MALKQVEPNLPDFDLQPNQLPSTVDVNPLRTGTSSLPHFSLNTASPSFQIAKNSSQSPGAVISSNVSVRISVTCGHCSMRDFTSDDSVVHSAVRNPGVD